MVFLLRFPGSRPGLAASLKGPLAHASAKPDQDAAHYPPQQAAAAAFRSFAPITHGFAGGSLSMLIGQSRQSMSVLQAVRQRRPCSAAG